MMKPCIAVARMLTLGMLLVLAGPATAQQDYPSKPIRFIVPFPPGGTNNLLARLVGQKLSESWGQPVIIDNRPGGNTTIGAGVLANSQPNGYTIMLNSSVVIINPLLFVNLPYDPVKDFAPVATTTSTELCLVLHPSVAANNLRELIALAKSRPGQLNYASTSTGGPSHLAGEMFDMLAGVKMQHIPYKGGGQLVTELIGGQVQMAFQSPIAVVSHLKNGRLKAIAISGETRSSALPQVPTFTEAGLPGMDVRYWHGVFAPARTPAGIINKLSAEIAKIILMPEVREKLVSQGLNPFSSTPAQFATLMKADIARYAKVIKAANIKIER